MQFMEFDRLSGHGILAIEMDICISFRKRRRRQADF